MNELKNQSFTSSLFDMNFYGNKLADAIVFLLEDTRISNCEVLEMFDPSGLLEFDYPKYCIRQEYVAFILKRYQPDTIVRVVEEWRRKLALNRGDVVEFINKDNFPYKGVILASFEDDGNDMVTVMDERGEIVNYDLDGVNDYLRKTGKHVDILDKLFKEKTK